MYWTPGGAGNRRTFTFSAWIKRGAAAHYTDAVTICSQSSSAHDGNNGIILWFESATAGLSSYNFQTSTDMQLYTEQAFRDPASWFHYVYAIDTTQAVEAYRQKMYINGAELTEFGDNYGPVEPALNLETQMNMATPFWLGRRYNDAYMDGYMAEVALIDGTAYAASDFGEFNSDSPTIWQPKDISGLTYGTNGFYLDFKDSAALGNDVSGNNNDLTTSGLAATDQCLDSPTNNFATLNPLQNYYDPGVFTQGNCTYTTAGGTGMYSFRTTTLGMSKSKWYMEFRKTTGDTNAQWGYASEFPTANNNYCGEAAGNYGLYGATGGLYTNASVVSTGWGTMSTGYVMLAIDLDNNFIYFGKDGTWLKSGDPTSGATGTGGQSITAASASTIGHYFFAVGDFSNTSGYDYQCNFGNGSFGDTAAGATNADDNDQGIFKYDVPTGYYALCTKNLAEFG